MALVRPTARTKAAFDAIKNETFYFTVGGGDLVTKNRITIVDQDTNEIAYQDTTAEGYYALNHIVPANTLTNGKYYYYYINTFNSSGTMSVDSNSVPFYCYTTPVLQVTNLPQTGDVIESTNYIFNITYSQTEGELLDYLICTIYDENGKEYIVSDKILSNEDNSYNFNVVGMANGHYSIGVVAVTVNDTEATLVPQSFTVRAVTPSVYARLKLTNECEKGYVEVESNLVNIEGDAGDFPVEYIDNNKIYLLPRQRYVKWSDNFKIPSDFTMGIWGQIGENYHHKDTIQGHLNMYTPLYTYNNTRLALLYPQQYVTWSGLNLQSRFTLGLWGSIGEIISNEHIEVFRFYNSDGAKIVLSMIREVPAEGTELKDCFVMEVFDKNNNRLCYGRTNYTQVLQPNDDYYLFVQKNGINWSLRLVRETDYQHEFNWNQVTHVQYGQSLAIAWNNSTDYPQNDGEQLYYNYIDDLFPFTSCRLRNGNFDHLNITSNATVKYNELTKLTDHYTVMNCDFNGDLIGNVGFVSEILRAWNDNDYGMKVNVVCEIPYGESNPKHCYEVEFYYKSKMIGWGRTNYVKLLNPQDDYALFIQKKSSDWTLGLTNLTQEAFSFNWGQPSQIRFGQTMSALQWNNNTEYGIGLNGVNWLESVPDDAFPLTYVQISNGIYDGLDVSKDTDKTQADYLSYVDWDYDTILNCDFNGNINGGNVAGIIAQLGSVRLKRKAKTSNKWITLKQVTIDVDPDIRFVYLDHYVPHGITQQYAIVPVTLDGVEGEYIIEEITPIWKYNFITIAGKTIPTYAHVQYGSVVNNRQYGVLQPIQSKFPIVVKNSKTAYLSGTITAMFLGENFMETRKINRLEIMKQIVEFQQLIDEGDTICLKDYNGWIILCKPTSGDTATFNANYGNGVSDIAFNWIRQGEYDNQDDLYNLGLININI